MMLDLGRARFAAAPCPAFRNDLVGTFRGTCGMVSVQGNVDLRGYCLTMSVVL